ncbi:MAG: hypothetical protein ABI840_11130 [bacterium]
MKTSIFKRALIVLAALTLFSFDTPNGWHKAGSNPENYEMEIVKAAGNDGKKAATIKSIEAIEGFGTLMQTCSPDKYKGKQIKMTGYVKSENVTDWAGLWLRVDQPGTRQPLSFDNMYDRAIKGTTEWKKYEILLDVPANASRIAYGALLAGPGQIWFDNIKFELVDNADNPPEPDKSVSSDTYNKTETVTDEPANLDFEK